MEQDYSYDDEKDEEGPPNFWPGYAWQFFGPQRPPNEEEDGEKNGPPQQQFPAFGPPFMGRHHRPRGCRGGKGRKKCEKNATLDEKPKIEEIVDEKIDPEELKEFRRWKKKKEMWLKRMERMANRFPFGPPGYPSPPWAYGPFNGYPYMPGHHPCKFPKKPPF